MIQQDIRTSNNNNRYSANYAESSNIYRLKYHPVDVEGECTLLSVTPIRKSYPIYIIVNLVCILFLGLPYFILYWYPILKKKLYFQQCNVAQATHFFVRNYDQVLTFPKKQEKIFYFSYKQSRPVVCFLNRKLTYIIQDQTVYAPKFNQLQRIYEIMNNKNLQRFTYNDEQVNNLISSYGLGYTQLPLTPIPILFIKQVIRPIYFFIIFCQIVWLYQGYYIYAGIIFATMLITLLVNLVQTYQNKKKIYKVAMDEVQIHAIRNGSISLVSSMYLVPGDIVFLKRQMKIPFDGILLQGQALVNDISLTGQSTPVVKRAQKIETQKDIKQSNTIFQGTNLIQVLNHYNFIKFDHYRQEYGVPVLITRTNFSTYKGQIIRILYYPGNQTDQFQSDSIKFFTFMFCLAILTYAGLCIRLRKHWGTKQYIQRLLNLITVTIPPELPVSLAFSRIVSMEKLRRKNIYCSSPKKIISGGLVNLLCFDKTGTLTQDQTTFISIIPAQSSKFANQILAQKKSKQKNRIQTMINNNPIIIKALNNMAINHSLYLDPLSNQLFKVRGNNMQLELFNFGEFTLIANNENNQQNYLYEFYSKRGHNGKIYRRFQFSYQIQRMSAIGSSTETGDQIYAYVRGLPESMEKIFNKQTFPHNYYEKLHQYMQKGYKVTAIGSKKVIGNYYNYSREEIQSNINFDGFQIFQNKIKPLTQLTIDQFQNCLLPLTIMTGDSMVSAVNAIYNCGLLDQNSTLITCDYNQVKDCLQFDNSDFNQVQQQQIMKQIKYPRKFSRRQTLKIWQNQQMSESSKSIKVGVGSTKFIAKNQQILDNFIYHHVKDNSYICMSALAFNKFFTKQQDEFNLTKNQQFILQRTVAFAKTKPNDKIKIISMYNKLGKKVAMCGKGVSNFGAFKQATIGLSLSIQQHSAAAPFTSQKQNIKALQQLLKQCRAALICNFSLFNSLALYSLIQFTSTVLVQFYYSTQPILYQYLYWDLFGSFLLSITIMLSQTEKKLSVQLPRYRFFSISNFISLFCNFILQFLGQLIVLILLSSNSFKETYFSVEELDLNYGKSDQIVKGSIFLFTNILYSLSFISLNISVPFRKRFYKNPYFMVLVLFVQTYNIVMIFLPSSRLGIFQIGQITQPSFLWFIFGFSLLIGVLMIVAQKIFYPPILRYLRKKYPQRQIF